ncbi:MAG: 16S rRNA processing protein RimM [Flavobacteriales bacterium]|nr:16S rRNA processing protein RimM [Flavobacteriales bacterium]
MNQGEYTLLGKVLKPHGIKGELILKREELAFNYLIPEFIFIEINGLYVPYYVVSYSDNGSGHDIINLEDLLSKDDANLVAGAQVFIPTTEDILKNPNTASPQNLISFEVVDLNEGFIGTVVSIIETKGQNILQIEKDDTEVLIPHTREIVTNINYDTKVINIEAPEGLIGLYL